VPHMSVHLSVSSEVSNRAYSLFLFGTVSPALFCINAGYSEAVKADSHIAWRAHAVPLPCRAAKGLERVFPI
jgi:hypothetical protein